LVDQIGSTYHCAPTNGLSKRTPGATLELDELLGRELELGATDDGTELELGATDDGTELELGAIELLGRELELGAIDDGTELELGLDGLKLEEDTELEEGLALELGAILLDVSPTTLVHVERAIQLLLFSQPQPLWVVTHNG
jgi:hypothetical protein